MKYLVKEMFTDLLDNGHAYSKGDTYPREGFEPSLERIKELSSTENKRGLVLIEAIEEPKPEKKAKAPKKVEEEEPKEEVVEPEKEEPKKVEAKAPKTTKKKGK